MASKEYVNDKEDFKAWYQGLLMYQRNMFKMLWEHVLWRDEYHNEVENWMKEVEEPKELKDIIRDLEEIHEKKLKNKADETDKAFRTKTQARIEKETES